MYKVDVSFTFSLKGNVIEPPTDESIDSAINRLQDVGAFDAKQQLTALGEHLSALPVDVRIGKLMLFGAIFNVLLFLFTVEHDSL